MDTQTFASLVAQERERLHDAIKAAKAKRQDAEREVAQLEAQSAAILAYDAALRGKGKGIFVKVWGDERGQLGI